MVATSILALVVSPAFIDRFTAKLVESGRDQLTWNTNYDSTYTALKYPGGDVAREKGVCTDVVIRAFRANGIDLQKLIIEHKRRNPGLYPKIGSSRRLDPNIDHRRCKNQIVFFTAHRAMQPITAEFLPGDLVYWKLNSGLDHVGLVSDAKGASGKYMVFHNMSTPKLEDVLGSWKIVAHIRYRR